jgi:hypothetical protein
MKSVFIRATGVSWISEKFNFRDAPCCLRKASQTHTSRRFQIAEKNRSIGVMSKNGANPVGALMGHSSATEGKYI